MVKINTAVKGVAKEGGRPSNLMLLGTTMN